MLCFKDVTVIGHMCCCLHTRLGMEYCSLTSSACAVMQTARSLPTSPILNGSDALADLTRDLDDRLRMDALKQQRGPSPFQVTAQW